MRLANIQGKLSRTEMKKIMAGTRIPGGTPECGDGCLGPADCSSNGDGACKRCVSKNGGEYVCTQ